VGQTAYQFYLKATGGDEKEMRKLDNHMYDPLLPLPFKPKPKNSAADWSVKPWVKGQAGALVKQRAEESIDG
jgi:hypothetical protein